MAPSVLMWREAVLPYSETFVRSQVDGLTRYRATLVGFCRPAAGSSLELRSEVVRLIDGEGRLPKMRRRLVRETGRLPSLDRLISGSRPRLVHAQFVTDALTVAPFARRSAVPLVVTAHGYDVAAPLRDRYGRDLVRRLAEQAALVIAVSEHIRRQAVAVGFPEHLVTVHRVGTELGSDASGQARDGRLLFVGRFVEKKGFPFLVEALKGLGSTYRSTEVVVVGGGPLESEWRKLASDAGVRCSFAGVRSNAEIREFMRTSSALVVPSITTSGGDTEGLPTVVVEAAAAALPVVAFDSGGIAEAVRHGSTGLLATERDTGTFRENIRSLLDSPALVAELGVNARQLATSEFDLVTQNAKLEDLYDRAS